MRCIQTYHTDSLAKMWITSHTGELVKDAGNGRDWTPRGWGTSSFKVKPHSFAHLNPFTVIVIGGSFLADNGKYDFPHPLVTLQT